MKKLSSLFRICFMFMLAAALAFLAVPSEAKADTKKADTKAAAEADIEGFYIGSFDMTDMLAKEMDGIELKDKVALDIILEIQDGGKFTMEFDADSLTGQLQTAVLNALDDLIKEEFKSSGLETEEEIAEALELAGYDDYDAFKKEMADQISGMLDADELFSEDDTKTEGTWELEGEKISLTEKSGSEMEGTILSDGSIEIKVDVNGEQEKIVFKKDLNRFDDPAKLAGDDDVVLRGGIDFAELLKKEFGEEGVVSEDATLIAPVVLVLFEDNKYIFAMDAESLLKNFKEFFNANLDSILRSQMKASGAEFETDEELDEFAQLAGYEDYAGLLKGMKEELVDGYQVSDIFGDSKTRFEGTWEEGEDGDSILLTEDDGTELKVEIRDEEGSDLRVGVIQFPFDDEKLECVLHVDE